MMRHWVEAHCTAPLVEVAIPHGLLVFIRLNGWHDPYRPYPCQPRVKAPKWATCFKNHIFRLSKNMFLDRLLDAVMATPTLRSKIHFMPFHVTFLSFLSHWGGHCREPASRTRRWRSGQFHPEMWPYDQDTPYLPKMNRSTKQSLLDEMVLLSVLCIGVGGTNFLSSHLTHKPCLIALWFQVWNVPYVELILLLGCQQLPYQSYITSLKLSWNIIPLHCSKPIIPIHSKHMKDWRYKNSFPWPLADS